MAAGPSSLEEYIGAVRKASEAARPAERAATFEATNPPLAAALEALKAAPSAIQEDRVAELYRRAGILDAAYDHYTHALRLDPHDATAFDGRARIWRDWGFPGFGLGDAYRAVYFAPHSAAARNTLGTLLQAIGQVGAARQQYLHALALKPGASFALNNICYAAVISGSPSAIDHCTQAVATAPQAPIIRHNLALAYAAAGQLDAARREFLRADPADASYNMGIVCLATGRYAQAATEFTAAAHDRPDRQIARLLADRARRLAAAQHEPDNHRD
jgi:Flp pilus assembly protein TadD